MTASRQLSIVEAFWKAMKNEQAAGAKRRPPPVVVEAAAAGRRLGEDGEVEFDVCICGGILGVMLGLSLVMRGQRVCIVEKRALEGRRQEWNISRHDLEVLVRLGLLTAGEVSSCVVTQWEQDRIAFKGEPDDMYIEGALDLGVDPRRLIGLLKARYLGLGGTVLEHHMFQKAHVYDDGVRVALKGFNVGGDADWNAGDMNRGSSSGDDEEGSGRGGSRDGSDSSDSSGSSGSGSSRLSVTCRLVVDCMGHYSPIVKQQRHGQPVEGMVIVVGGCMAAAETENGTATEKDKETVAPGCDLLVTIDDSQDDMQYFWETFPAEGGKSKTVYMFAYADADPARPSMIDIFDTYLSNLERYQGVPLEKIQWKRVLLGAFPCYSRGVPLKPAFDRVIQAGTLSCIVVSHRRLSSSSPTH